ncbi:hypothetical protein Cob_v012101 [Colletotrichum orbiculare MAFF 240422]|uniref:Zn(2)-C6 fungal-type domain-containing protein n=1 Tax=Colletotrichum orbiculare (strain 104-T / ATCC 96160 / CBS 514.97 / LARS 414 / MAFF 240422) TaxID=1213857 RepID=A0A484FAK1_COLOR|nr:hypothetical protein Cob_v012101 [Colletotrichum orbiculare MAFF 240422]
MSHPSYAPNYNAPAPGPPLMVPRSHGQSLKERKESYSQASLALKHAVSKPNVRLRQADLSDANQAGLAGDKKRNKLGYHRTSVACGHCRRRKIRCIPSPADIQGRCINCIRLKKECSFYPVDQPPPPQTTDARPKAPSRASTGTNVASASSSPAMATGRSPEMAQYQKYQHAAMSSTQNMAPPTMRPSGVTETFGPDGKVVVGASRAYEFAQQAMGGWMPTEAGSVAGPKPSNLNDTWRTYPQESPVTPSFSPYTPQGPSSAGWGTAINADPHTREELGWASFMPPGTMPFPGEAQLPSQYPATAHGRSFGRKTSTMSMGMFPTQVATAMSGVDAQGTSLSAGAVPPPGYGSWDQPYTYSKSNEGYEGWEYEDSRDN